MKTENTHLNDLLQMYDLTALIKEPTCYQSQHFIDHLHRPNYIDHFLTNWKALFKHCQTFRTGLSDHHKLISTIMKSGILDHSRKRFIGLIKNLTTNVSVML